MRYKTQRNKRTNKNIKQTKSHRHRQQYGGLPEGRGVGGVAKGRGGQICGVGRWIDSGWWAHNAIYSSCVLECTLETNVILLTNVTPINLVKYINKMRFLHNLTYQVWMFQLCFPPLHFRDVSFDWLWEKQPKFILIGGYFKPPRDISDFKEGTH